MLQGRPEEEMGALLEEESLPYLNFILELSMEL
jgi:hypothetical protein